MSEAELAREVARLRSELEELKRQFHTHLGPKGQTTTAQIPHTNMARESSTAEAIAAVEAIAITAGRYL